MLQACGIDYIDESEVLTPADEVHHINKHNFPLPFVCGCRNLGEALRRIAEGAAMIRTKVWTLFDSSPELSVPRRWPTWPKSEHVSSGIEFVAAFSG